MDVEVGEHPAGALGHARGDQGLAARRGLVEHAVGRHVVGAAQLDVGGGDELAGDVLAPRGGDGEQGVFLAGVAGLDAAEEGVAGELVVALPLQAEGAGVEEQVAAVGGGHGQPELFGQRGEVRGFAPGAALVVQEGEVGDVFGRFERDGRARMHLVVERLAQGMLFEQGHEGGRAVRRDEREGGSAGGSERAFLPSGSRRDKRIGAGRRSRAGAGWSALQKRKPASGTGKRAKARGPGEKGTRRGVPRRCGGGLPARRGERRGASVEGRGLQRAVPA